MSTTEQNETPPALEDDFDVPEETDAERAQRLEARERSYKAAGRLYDETINALANTLTATQRLLREQGGSPDVARWGRDLSDYDEVQRLAARNVERLRKLEKENAALRTALGDAQALAHTAWTAFEEGQKSLRDLCLIVDDAIVRDEETA